MYPCKFLRRQQLDASETESRSQAQPRVLTFPGAGAGGHNVTENRVARAGTHITHYTARRDVLSVAWGAGPVSGVTAAIVTGKLDDHKKCFSPS